MDVCDAYGVDPLRCVIIYDFELTKQDTDEKVRAHAQDQLGGTIAGGQVMLIYDNAGMYRNDILVFFKEKRDFNTFLTIYEVEFIFYGKHYQVKSVRSIDAVKPRDAHRPDVQTVKVEGGDKLEPRKIGKFSGSVRPHQNEVSIREWLVGAREVANHSPGKSNEWKVQVLRNTLVKHALVLVSSVDFVDPPRVYRVHGNNLWCQSFPRSLVVSVLSIETGR